MFVYVKHQVQRFTFGTGTFHLTLLKPKGSLQINDSINLKRISSDFDQGIAECEGMIDESCSDIADNELSAQINTTNFSTKGKKKIGTNHS